MTSTYIPKTPQIECRNHFSVLNNDSDFYVAYQVNKSGVRDDRGWIFDCGATDTMSYDRADFGELTKSKRIYIETAGGDLVPVEGTGTIQISPTLKISNCLYVPTLSQKLMYVSHVTRELNCRLLMQPECCFL